MNWAHVGCPLVSEMRTVHLHQVSYFHNIIIMQMNRDHFACHLQGGITPIADSVMCMLVAVNFATQWKSNSNFLYILQGRGYDFSCILPLSVIKFHYNSPIFIFCHEIQLEFGQIFPLSINVSIFIHFATQCDRLLSHLTIFGLNYLIIYLFHY